MTVNPVTGRANLKRRPEVRRAAARVFRKHSYSGTTMDMVAAEVGLNKGTLYHYYPSKAELLFDVVHLPLRSLLDGLEETLAGDEDPEQEFRALMVVSVRKSIEWHDEIGVYFQEMRWLDQWLSADRLAAVRKLETRYTERLRLLLARARRLRRFTDIDPAAVRHAIAGMNGFVFSWFDPHGRLTPDELATAYADLLLEGLLVRETPQV